MRSGLKPVASRKTQRRDPHRSAPRSYREVLQDQCDEQLRKTARRGVVFKGTPPSPPKKEERRQISLSCWCWLAFTTRKLGLPHKKTPIIIYNTYIYIYHSVACKETNGNRRILLVLRPSTVPIWLESFKKFLRPRARQRESIASLGTG